MRIYIYKWELKKINARSWDHHNIDLSSLSVNVLRNSPGLRDRPESPTFSSSLKQKGKVKLSLPKIRKKDLPCTHSRAQTTRASWQVYGTWGRERLKFYILGSVATSSQMESAEFSGSTPSFFPDHQDSQEWVGNLYFFPWLLLTSPCPSVLVSRQNKGCGIMTGHQQAGS